MLRSENLLSVKCMGTSFHHGVASLYGRVEERKKKESLGTRLIMEAQMLCMKELMLYIEPSGDTIEEFLLLSQAEEHPLYDALSTWRL